MRKTASIQLGKNGITPNFIQTLESHFKKHKNVRVSVLKSAREDRSSVKKAAEDLVEKLGGNYSSKIIGFVIILRKGKKKSI